MEPYEADDFRVLMKRLDDLVAAARPVPLMRSQVILDRESIYDVLDSLRASLPEAIKDARWFREKRKQDGDPPLREGEVAPDVFTDIDAVDDLIHESRTVPLTNSMLVERDRLSPILDRLRAALVPLGQELADFKSIYPSG